MLRFIQGIFEQYKIFPDQDNILHINDDILIFVSEVNNETTLICPCFPAPSDQMDLLELITLNCSSNVSYFHLEGLILARLSFRLEEDFQDMMAKFDAYLQEISRAIDYFVHRRR